MGYGLAGAIGAALANPDRRTVLIEGDGGFSQNMQEIGTAAINKLNIKMFVFDDSGYASIRMTQKNYFQGRYLGCDVETGLGLPDWEKLFPAWNVPVMRLEKHFMSNLEFINSMNNKGIHAYIVPIDPEQTYFPKITSKLLKSGAMESNPLHIMSPEMTNQEVKNYLRYFT
jgi:acetolactate synthase-1/2/3 large subunit